MQLSSLNFCCLLLLLQHCVQLLSDKLTCRTRSHAACEAKSSPDTLACLGTHSTRHSVPAGKELSGRLFPLSSGLASSLVLSWFSCTYYTYMHRQLQLSGMKLCSNIHAASCSRFLQNNMTSSNTHLSQCSKALNVLRNASQETG